MKPRRALRSGSHSLIRSQGITLLEVLIAVLVLSLGLLGLAGLQMSALRNNESSLQRSMAVIESYSIVDAMRIDRTNARNGAFNITLDDDPASGTFAGNQLEDWRTRLAALLGPAATGSVNCAGTSCTVIVRWNDQRGTSGAADQTITTQVEL